MVARDKELAQKCGLFKQGTHIPYSPALHPSRHLNHKRMLMLGVDTMLPYERFDDRLEHRDVSTPAIIYREILPSVSP